MCYNADLMTDTVLVRCDEIFSPAMGERIKLRKGNDEDDEQGPARKIV